MRGEDTPIMLHSFLHIKRAKSVILVFPEGHLDWKSVIKIMPGSVVENQGVARASSHMEPYQEEEHVGVTVDDANVDCDLRDPIGDCLAIDIGAAMQEEDIEICEEGRSQSESDSDTSESSEFVNSDVD